MENGKKWGKNEKKDAGGKNMKTFIILLQKCSWNEYEEENDEKLISTTKAQ